MSKVLMCEANVSEGRRADVVAALVGEIEAIEGVRIADWSSDADHHRSVITFVGPPQKVLEAAKAMARLALEA